MKHLFEYLNNYYYDSLVINEVCNMIAEEEMVNESFKSSIVQKLAQTIYNAEKTRNKAKVDNEKERQERSGYSFDPHLVNFASVFGPKTENGRWNTKGGIQGLKWSEITDDDFKEYAPDDKELGKLIKKTYGKGNAQANFIVMQGDKVINFIKAYGKDEKDCGMFYFKFDEIKKYSSGNEYVSPGELKEIKKQYYSYQQRSLKAAEVIDALKGLASIDGVKVYALEITDDMIKKYQDLYSDRKKAKEGVINYDKESLEKLRKNQVARYKVLADEMRANKLQKDPTYLFNEIKEAQDKVVALFKKIIGNPDYLDQHFDLARIMDYTAHAYEQFYSSMKSTRNADRREKEAEEEGRDNPKRFRSYHDEDAKRYINDAKEYLDKVKKMIKDIEDQL